MRTGDPQFDKLLLSSNLISSDNMESDKKFLFYYVCIVVRFILYSLTLVFHDYKYLPHLILVFSLFALLNLLISLSKGNNNQWWSKKFQLVIAILLIIASIMLIFNWSSNTYLIPIILFGSLFGGIIQSLMSN